MLCMYISFNYIFNFIQKEKIYKVKYKYWNKIKNIQKIVKIYSKIYDNNNKSKITLKKQKYTSS